MNCIPILKPVAHIGDPIKTLDVVDQSRSWPSEGRAIGGRSVSAVVVQALTGSMTRSAVIR